MHLLRGVFLVEENPGNVNKDTIDFVTIATTGNAVDFGDLTTQNKRHEMAVFQIN